MLALSVLLVVFLRFLSFLLLCLRSIVLLVLIYDFLRCSKPLFVPESLGLSLILLAVTKEIADEERSAVLLGLLLGSLDNLPPLLFLFSFFIDVSPVLIALEVFRFFLQTQVVGNMTLTTGNDHEIFPVLDYHDNEDDELCGSDGSQRRKCIGFLWTICDLHVLIGLNNEECSEGSHHHGDGAVDDLIFQLSQMRLVPVFLRLTWLIWDFIHREEDGLHEIWSFQAWLFFASNFFNREDLLDRCFKSHLPIGFLALNIDKFVRIVLNLLLLTFFPFFALGVSLINSDILI